MGTSIRAQIIHATLMLVICAVTVNLVSCSVSDDSEDSPPGIKQNLLFYYEYKNIAWGDQHIEYFIDSDGNVWRGGGDWLRELENVRTENHQSIYYEVDPLEERYSNSAKCIVMKIDISELNEMYKLLKNVAEGDFSKLVYRGNDMGTIIYGCLYYDVIGNKYEQVILRVTGDWAAENLSSSAEKLADWLEEKINNVYEVDPYQVYDEETGPEFRFDSDVKGFFGPYAHSDLTIEAVYEGKIEYQVLDRTIAQLKFQPESDSDSLMIRLSPEFTDKMKLRFGETYSLRLQFIWDMMGDHYGLTISQNDQMLYQGITGWKVDSTPFIIRKNTPVFYDDELISCFDFVSDIEYVFTLGNDTTILRKGETAVLDDYEIELSVSKGEMLSYLATRLND